MQVPLATDFVRRCLAVLFSAAALCVPYLDGTLNVDAAEVLQGERGEGIDDIPDGTCMDMTDHELAPDVTILITGVSSVWYAAWYYLTTFSQAESLSCFAQLNARSSSIARASFWAIAQITLCSGSWSTIREISFTLGMLARVLPLAPPPPLMPLLTSAQADDIGQFFVSSLAAVKHSGATEKLHLGLQTVCHCLLQQQSPALSSLPAKWLEQLYVHVTRCKQTRTSIVRRSAGLPLAFMALCLAEVSGSTKTLLHTSVQRLLSVAKGVEGEDEGDAWPRVHAFNCLRVMFDSAALAADVSGFCAATLQACVLAMAASEWEVCRSCLRPVATGGKQSPCMHTPTHTLFPFPQALVCHTSTDNKGTMRPWCSRRL
jgi:hypothetical protein